MRDITNTARLTMQDRNVDVQEGIRLRNVRRRLFQEEEEIEGGGTSRNLNTGSEDNVVNSFFEEIRKHREEAKERWNFDFEKEIPLEGNFEWVKLDRDRNEIPMNAEVQNKTEKIEKNGNDELGQLKEDEMTKNKIQKENKEKEEEEEDEEDAEDEGEVPPEGKEVDADDKTESRRQQNRNHSRIVDVL